MKYAIRPEILDNLENSKLLTRRERQVFNLYFREGLNYAEIATELVPEVSIKTVGNILKEIRNKANNLKAVR